MNRKMMAADIARRMDGVSGVETARCVNAVLEAIMQAVVTEGRLELRGFGVFETRVREAHDGRNPRTGERVCIPAKRVVTFKPGKELRERVSRMQGVCESVRAVE